MIKLKCDRCKALLIGRSLRKNFYQCDICGNVDTLIKGKIKKYRKVVLINEN